MCLLPSPSLELIKLYKSHECPTLITLYKVCQVFFKLIFPIPHFTKFVKFFIKLFKLVKLCKVYITGYRLCKVLSFVKYL